MRYRGTEGAKWKERQEQGETKIQREKEGDRLSVGGGDMKHLNSRLIKFQISIYLLSYHNFSSKTFWR